jgi:hypothetical protein
MDIAGEFTPINAEGFIRTSAIRLTTFRKIYNNSPYNG